ncbi:MAG TPA: hypothetical protein VFU02_15525 [Polyangiaceae bacterium]|nr:hypothetical protein [Polyangiaceae bacterium]
MNFADFGDSRRLLALLQGALAVGLVGACKLRESSVSTRLVSPQSSAITLRPGSPVDEPACRRLCSSETDDDVTCAVTTVALTPAAGGVVRCQAGQEQQRMPLPARMHELVQFGQQTPLERARCESICPSLAGPELTCVIERVEYRDELRRGEAIPEDELFVLCQTYHPGGLESDIDIVGPLPSGRLARGVSGFAGVAGTVAEYCSRSAYYEAASIVAFRQLARILERLSAPPALAKRAQTFARDEARHCRGWLDLARASGAPRAATRTWPSLAHADSRTPSLYELCLDNLRAGCIGESYGAWLALHQARSATRPAMRRLAQRIARDEAAHAALAFELHGWLWPQLTPAERSSCRAAVVEALADLASPLPVRAEVAAEVGIPAATATGQLTAPLRALLVRGLATTNLD